METTISKNDLLTKVEAALNNIRPYLEADGGNVKLLDISDDMIVKLEMLGNCGSCPMSAMTLKAGVEEAIKKDVPEIKGVIAANNN
ncbi:MAG TPA: NifU family protein [Cytophagaceae bacterium]|jgi:Fe-S cluster biogenesis protein NfuA|nr:NifU family protein [Cytophagaceae bacterium]